MLQIVYRTNAQIWIYDLERFGTPRPLITEGFVEHPVWSPDGREVAFWSPDAGRNPPTMVVSATGVSPPQVLVEDGGGPYSWSANGSLSFYRAMQGGSMNDLWVASLEAGGTEVLLDSPSVDDSAYFSPEGDWISYFSGFTGQFEVHVEPYPPTGDRWQVSTEGREYPRWSPDGTKIYFVNNNEFFAVEFSSGPENLGQPQYLFAGAYVDVGGHQFDVSPDGGRFLVVKASDPRSSTSNLVFVENWLSELEGLFGTN